ncbi:MAG TPA: carboxylesterase family protein [Ktedonobacteraceae bacterium]|nr:carboxylesterase family protein [Ktedonobacteraceae bacterium]
MVDLIVETTAGKVLGTTTHAIHAFRGIPYGAPTGGRNRFRPPQKREPWSGVREALKYGASSPQPVGGMDGLRAILGEMQPEVESEDCLYLNVWTPAPGDGGNDLCCSGATAADSQWVLVRRAFTTAPISPAGVML